jgi:Carboxypeptidase regulatory-like domain/TonB dependent receptor/TonB-dependent Receptor Plug Domain
MRLVRSWLLLAVALLALAAVTTAQTTNGTISGHVSDAQGLSIPGATVTASSPNLQGVRSVVTSENGDFVIPLLPSGVYTITFELSGFEKITKQVTLAPTQNLPLNAELGPAAISETVVVSARTADVLVQTTTIATNFKQDLIATLPTNRDINAVLLQAPAVHATGPSGNYSIAGSMSFESLFLVNGVTVNENLRGQAENLYIEDAIQETTVASGGISAEYGRFTGGVVNVVTKSGGNLFTGSFRDTLNNDNWRKLVEKQTGDTFTNDTQIDKTIPTYEYTIGGPIMRDRLWFFHAGRVQTQEFNRQLVITNIPYINTNETRRFEEKLTFSVNPNHRFQGAFTNFVNNQLNNTFNTSASMDLNSLEDRKVPERLFTINYNGILTPTLTFEARYSERHLTFSGSGAKSTDIINGTLLIDPAGRRYWSATFCGVCEAETRDNQDIFVKGTYFYSRKGRGSHNMVFGFDTFNDQRFANNHQSGSDYRILNAPEIVRGTDLFPQFVNGTTQIRWQPIFISNLGTTFRTNSAFYNDNWQVSPRLSATIGLRWDKNSGANGNGDPIAKDTAFSPRFGIVWDPTGRGQWSVTGSVAKYVDGLLNSIADSTSPAGNADTYTFRYTGPTINPDVNAPNLVPTATALQQLFAWFNANGGSNLPLVGVPTVRGVSPQILGSLDPPRVWEYAAGVGRQLGSRASARADFSYRKWGNFYIAKTDMTTGKATDNRSFAPAAVRGRLYDLTYITNDESGTLKRQYAGLTLSSTYRISARTDVGGNYTLSRLWGNVDGETPNNGPISDGRFQYPEYTQASWNTPDGDLSLDQRHRARFWINYGVPLVPGNLTVSVLESLESGVPYSASNQNAALANGVNAAAFVTNPGYLTPPDGSSITYFYTARDAFWTDGQKRTDLAVSYNYGLGAGSRKIDLFIQGQVINVFNQAQLCGCGGSVFANGGNVQNQFIDTTVRDAVATPGYQTFNPFTTTPVQGVNWDYGLNFGHAVNRFAYTSPRMYRLTFGVRF